METCSIPHTSCSRLRAVRRESNGTGIIHAIPSRTAIAWNCSIEQDCFINFANIIKGTRIAGAEYKILKHLLLYLTNPHQIYPERPEIFLFSEEITGKFESIYSWVISINEKILNRKLIKKSRYFKVMPLRNPLPDDLLAIFKINFLLHKEAYICYQADN